MNLLITGGAGFIGSNFAHRIVNQAQYEKIVILDVLTYAANLKNLASILPRVTFVKGSINDYQLVTEILRENKIDHVAHFAAESHVDRSIHSPDAFVETNIVGTHQLLKACRDVWMLGQDSVASSKRFLHVSTDEVFGSLTPDAPAFTEDSTYLPNSPYSASKASSDLLVRAYHHTYGLPTLISNCSNNYGAFHFPEKLIPLMILNILGGKPLPIYGDGLQVRDWLHVEDHCSALSLILKNGRVGDTYCVGGNNEVANIEIVRLLCEIIDSTVSASPQYQSHFPDALASEGRSSIELITHVKDRPGHDRRYAVNASKIKSQLNFTPAETLETGLNKTVAWYLDNREWWRDVLDGSYRNWLELNYQQR